MIKIEEIIKLLDKGFEEKLIAFELDIPEEVVKECKHILEKRKEDARRMAEKEEKSKKQETIDENKIEGKSSVTEEVKKSRVLFRESMMLKSTKSNRQTIVSKKTRITPNMISESADSKINKMRKKYEMLYEPNKQINIQTKSQNETTENIDLAITEIENKIDDEMNKSLDSKDIKQRVKQIIEEILLIIEDIVTISQVERIHRIVASKELMTIARKNKDLYIKIIATKSKVERKLAEIISKQVSGTENIEELQELSRILSKYIQVGEQTYIESVKTKIYNKIYVIARKANQNNTQMNISENILQIVENIAQGSFDIKVANENIQQEVQKMMLNKSKSKFALTEEQLRKQIVIQIKNILRSNPDKYPIVNVELALENIIELDPNSDNMGNNINTVVENIIARGDYETAKELCKKYAKNNNSDRVLYTYLKGLRKEIEKAEIGKFVLDCILSDSLSPEEEKIFLELLDKKIEESQVDTSKITLGKSKDGLRLITLADIYGNPSKGQR